MRVGVILAGGESKRFHGNKLLALVDNIPVIKRVYNALNCCVDKIYFSVRDAARAKEISNIIHDDNVGYVYDYADLNGGPYAAIISSIDKIDGDEFIIVPGDTPWIKSIFFKRWFKIIEEYRVTSSTVIWGNSVLESLYQFIDKRRLRNIIKLLYLMRKEGRATDILRASPCVLFVYVGGLVDDPLWLAHVNTRENLVNPVSRNPVKGFIEDDILLKRSGITSVPLLDALDKLSSKDYKGAIEVLMIEMREYFDHMIYHLVYHVAKDIENVVNRFM